MTVFLFLFFICLQKRLHIIEKNGQREFMQPISFGTKAQTKDDDNKIGPAWLHTVCVVFG